MNFNQALHAVKIAFPLKPEHVQRLYASHAVYGGGSGGEALMLELKATLKTLASERKQLREKMREKFGAGKYRIDNAGGVSVYSVAPNSNKMCWWLYADSVERAIERLQY